MRFFLLGLIVLLWVCAAIAEEPAVQKVGGDEQPQAEADAAPKVKKKAKGNRAREKETEGTEAPNRFEADTVIKSHYKLNGEPLEVDPD